MHGKVVQNLKNYKLHYCVLQMNRDICKKTTNLNKSK